MSSNIVLPTSTDLVEDFIKGIYNAGSADILNSTLSGFLSEDVAITLNGARISVPEFARQIRLQRFDEVKADIKILETVQTPPGQAVEFASVAIFFTVVFVEGILVRDSPEELKLTASLNAYIAQDANVPTPKSPLPVSNDKRKINQLNIVLLEQQVTSNTGV